MTTPESPIIDFYPTSFQIDMNGKKMLWQGVALLPFIDEKRLLDAMRTRYPGLTEDEVRRNSWGSNAIYVSDVHKLYPFFEGLYGKRKDKEVSFSVFRCITYRDLTLYFAACGSACQRFQGNQWQCAPQP